MSLKIQKEKVALNTITHAVRASQAVLQYGVGAMVDFPDQTLMTAAPEYWQEKVEKIHDERLEKLLHVDYFGMPGNKDEERYRAGISYVRFPEWYFCPRCRRFQPISEWRKEYLRFAKQKDKDKDPYMVWHMRCPRCKQELVVARIVTVCECGHIDDFPWVKWVHAQSMGGPKRICGNPKLTFKTGASSTEGLEGLEIACETCGAKASLRGAFSLGKLESLDADYPGVYDFKCAGKHPWKHTKEKCNRYPKVMQRGGSSVYFPVIASSLVIPPFSNLLTSKIEGSKAFEECKTTLTGMIKMMPDMRDAITDNVISQYSEKIALEVGVPVDKVTDVLERKWKADNEEAYTTLSVKYRAEEYDALTGAVTVESEDYGDFLREGTRISDYGLPFLKSISLIHKIREVQALIGFSRISPAERSETAAASDKIVSVKEDDTNWYPAYQVRGEGIFIEFDPDLIDRWSHNNTAVAGRVEMLNAKYRESFLGQNNPRTVTAKYLLLHTISHLLIKQLSFECGYSIASIKERIYCSEAEDGKRMAGVLIYTASGDSEGTLGGLVRQGRADVFPDMFKKAIESAMTCSNDPVCSLSTGQGRDSLNLAACYSCTLIPETSCEAFNIFLDRGVVVGTVKEPSLGFFAKQLYGENKWSFDHTVILPREEVKQPLNAVHLMIEKGTDMSEVAYDVIWSNLRQWADDDHEIALLEELGRHGDSFSGKEKPEQDCRFRVIDGEEHYYCDLIWKESKVMLFSGENENDYRAASQSSEWTCFLCTDPDLDWQTVSSAIKEK